MIEGIIVGFFASFVVGMIGFFVRSAISDFSTDIHYRIGLLRDGASGLSGDLAKLNYRVSRIENLMGDMGTGD